MHCRCQINGANVSNQHLVQEDYSWKIFTLKPTAFQGSTTTMKLLSIRERKTLTDLFTLTKRELELTGPLQANCINIV